MLNKTERYIQRAFLFALFLCSIVKVVLLFYVSNIGFDFNDEGYLMNIYQYGDCYRQTIQNNCYPLFIFPGKLNLSITGLRIIKFIIEISLGGWLLFLLLRRSSNRSLSQIFTGFALVICASNLGGLSRMFGYSELVFFLIMVSVNFLLCSINVKSVKRKIILFIFWAAISGCVLCIVSIVKISTAFFLFIFYTALIIYWGINSKNKFRIAIVLFSFVTFLCSAFVSYFFFFNTGIKDYLAWVKEFFPVAQLIGYSPIFILTKSYIGIDIIQQGVFHFLPFVAAVILYWILKRKLSKDKLYVIMLLGGIFTLAAIVLVYSPAWLTEIRFRIISIFFFLTQMAAFIFFKEQGVNRKQVSLIVPILIISVIPFLAVVGTNVPLSVSLGGYLMPWMVICIFVFTASPHKTFRLTTIITLLLATFFQYYSFGIVDVVRNPVSLLDQTEPYTTSSQTIFLDSNRVNFLRAFKEKASNIGMKPGEKVIPVNNLPGEVYLLGFQSEGLAWYLDPLSDEMQLGTAAYNCYHINLNKNRKQPYVFLTHSKIHINQLKCLKECGYDLEQSYTLADSIFNPIRESVIYLYKPQ